MAEKSYLESGNPSNVHQMAPLLPQPFGASASGIDCLRACDVLLIKQIPSMTELIFGIAGQAKYDILNNRGERMFQAAETSTFCQRFCCTSRRRFTLRITDNNNQEIILMRREFKCCSGYTCCANIQCCSQEITVESPPGTFIGTVSQEGSCWRLRLAIKDANDTTVLTVMGPRCICDGALSCCCKNKFTLLGTDGTTEIGAIHKKYSGAIQEIHTSADTFSLQVPLDLDVKMKAVTLGALFLIDYMIFAAVPTRSSN